MLDSNANCGLHRQRPPGNMKTQEMARASQARARLRIQRVEQNMNGPRKTRYCIQCGTEIGDSPSCTNEDCGGIPSFFRDVRGPDPAAGPRAAGQARRRRAAVSRSVTVRPDTVRPDTVRPDDLTRLAQPPSRGAVRRTMSLDLTPVAVLKGVGGGRDERPLRLGPNEVGACAPASIVIDRPEMSSRHARIDCRRGTGETTGSLEVTVTDLGSKNGTYVNGKRIEQATLAAGDKIRFASAEYELWIPQREEPRFTVGM